MFIEISLRLVETFISETVLARISLILVSLSQSLAALAKFSQFQAGHKRTNFLTRKWQSNTQQTRILTDFGMQFFAAIFARGNNPMFKVHHIAASRLH